MSLWCCYLRFVYLSVHNVQCGYHVFVSNTGQMTLVLLLWLTDNGLQVLLQANCILWDILMYL